MKSPRLVNSTLGKVPRYLPNAALLKGLRSRTNAVRRAERVFWLEQIKFIKDHCLQPTYIATSGFQLRSSSIMKSSDDFSAAIPHPTTPEDWPSSEQDEDILPDAPPTPADASKNADETGSSDGSVDTMMQSTSERTDATKIEIKLEDLFNDDDEEDAEFPSSVPTTNNNLESSPPPAPL